jgi:hypothetical protein
MSPFAFLLVPVVIILLASLFMWLRGRNPTTLKSGIDGFNREMRALSPDDAPRSPRRFEAERPSEPAPRDRDG